MTQEYIHKIKRPPKETYTFIILSAGKSKVKEYKSSVALYPISKHNKLIDVQVNTIKKVYNNFEVVLVMGMESEKIISHCSLYKNMRLVENTNYRKTSVLDSLKMAINCTLKSNVFIIYGDKVFNQEAITCSKNKPCVYINQHSKKNCNLGVSYDKNKFINMCYGLPSSWAEIVYIPSSSYYLVKEVVNNAKQDKIFTFEKFINEVSKKIPMYIQDSKNIKITPIKEIASENFVLQS
jgi:hypothetical protein